MRIGVLRVSFMIFNSQSLKQKRMVLRSVKDRLMNQFNISVAEIGSNDKWQIAELGIAAVGNNGRFVNSVMEEVKNFLDSNPAIRIIEAEIEVI